VRDDRAWVIDEGNEYRQLDPKSERFYPVRDPDGWWSAVIREDGCVDLHRFHNEPNDGDPDMTDYIHICDVNYLIERLQALVAVAQDHFGEDWA
jgi:hypothetical protein